MKTFIGYISSFQIQNTKSIPYKSTLSKVK